jgi:hypothetical protein
LEAEEMKKLIVTNNPMVRERYSQQYDLKYEETSFVGVLKQVRDLVHRGYRLLTHPLSGSIKPNETPYKSVLLEESTGKIDEFSVRVIEEAVLTCDKFSQKKYPYKKDVTRDFQFVDLTLFESGLESDMISRR